MKLPISIILLLCCFSQAWGQDWRDELRAARASYKQGDYDKALRTYRSAQKLAPDEVDLSDEIGQTAYKAEKYDVAEKVYQQSSSRKGNAQQQARTYHNLGNARMKQQKYDEAIASYKEALRHNPERNETRYNLSRAMRQKQAQQQQQAQNKPQQNPPNPPKQKPKDPAAQPNQPQPNKSGQQPKSGEPQDDPGKPQLSDEKTNRMLDELMKREMETKKKFSGGKDKGGAISSGKDW
jgi:Ca-activated chloride channel family protein